MRLARLLAVAAGWTVGLPAIQAVCFGVTGFLFLGWGPEDFPIGFAFLAVAGHLVVRHARRAKWSQRTERVA
jgi:hypothetical protein